MKKFLFMFLFAAAVASAFTFVVAQDEDVDGKKFVIHGEVRQRADFTDNFLDFTSDFDDSFLIFPYRVRIGAEGHFGENVVGYVEFQNFGEWGDSAPSKGGSDSPLGGDNESNAFFASLNFDEDVSTGFFNEVQMYEGWVSLGQMRGSGFSLKLGRQEIVKGSEMLLGDKDFYGGLSHDAAMASWAFENFDLDVWYSRPSQSTTGGVPDHQSVNFYGVWAQWGKWENGADFAGYLLHYEDGRSTGLPDPARRDFWTIGGRTSRDVTGRNAFNWNAEIAYQTGDQNDQNGTGALGDNKDIKASAFEGTLEFNLHSGDLDHRFHITGVTASGDTDSTDTDAESFDPLFQDSHARYGYSDLFQLSDLTAWSLGYNVRIENNQFGADVWSYKAAEEIVFPPAEDDLGKELDLWWKYQYSKNTQWTVAYAWFKPGDVFDVVIANTDNASRLYGNLRLRF